MITTGRTVDLVKVIIDDTWHVQVLLLTFKAFYIFRVAWLPDLFQVVLFLWLVMIVCVAHGSGISVNTLLKLKTHVLLKTLLIYSANPKSRPVRIIVFAHVVRTYVYVRTSLLFKSRKQNNRKQYSLMAWLWVWPCGSLMTPVLSNILFPSVIFSAPSQIPYYIEKHWILCITPL